MANVPVFNWPSVRSCSLPSPRFSYYISLLLVLTFRLIMKCRSPSPIFWAPLQPFIFHVSLLILGANLLYSCDRQPVGNDHVLTCLSPPLNFLLISPHFLLWLRWRPCCICPLRFPSLYPRAVDEHCMMWC